MTSIHGPRHDAMLADILTGDPGAGSPELVELQACALCRERLRSLQAVTVELESAGREQRSVLADARRLPASPEDGLVSGLVRAGLQARHSPGRPWLWPLLALAAALVVGAILWSRMPDRRLAPRPPDQLLHQGEAWPRGAGIDARELVEHGFEWLGDVEETYELSLFADSDLITPWDTIPCKSNHCRIDRQYVDRMRALGTDWQWQYRRTSPPEPGSPSVALSEIYSFSFSR